MGDIAKLEGIGVDDAVNRVLDLPPNAEDEDEGAGDLRFAEFDIESVLNKAAPLLAAKTSDMEALGMGNDSGDDKKLTKAARLRLAKQSLKQRLGMV